MIRQAAKPTGFASDCIRLVAYGFPAPQGSKSFKGMRRSKKTGLQVAILVESSKAVKPWRSKVEAEAKIVMQGREPMSGPLRVTMIFTMPKPASAPKGRRTYPCTRPDLSKLARSTEDALTDGGLWGDDGQVVEYAHLAKRYPGEGQGALQAPGVVIIVERVRDEMDLFR